LSSKVIAIGVLALAATSCSLSLPEQQACQADSECLQAFGPGHTCGSGGFCRLPAECTTNADCRAEAGFGYVCGAEQRCEFVTPNPRCTKTLPERLFVPDEYPDAIVFGSIVERGFAGDAVLEQAAELAVAEANEGNGLDGRQFGIVLCTDEENSEYDSEGPDQSDVQVATWMVETLGVPAIFGPTTSSRTQAAFEAVRNSGTVFISPSATSADLTQLDNPEPSDDSPGQLWRTVPPDAEQGRVIADDMIARGVTTALVIVQQDAYAQGLAAVFKDEFEPSGQVSQTLMYQNDSQLADSVVAATKDSAAEILFLSSRIDDEKRFLSVAGEFGLSSKGIFLSDTAATLDVLDGTPAELFPNIRLTRPVLGSGEIYNQFIAAFSLRFPGQNPRQYGFLGQSYDAAWMLLYGAAYSAAHENGWVTGVGIARGLRKLSDGEKVPVRASSWGAARDALAAGESIDIVGASGEINFNPATEETEAGIEVVALSNCDGPWEFVLVKPGEELPDCPEEE
jgi:ABC-type branched-subunit amino acid transport system substrate-binding protein